MKYNSRRHAIKLGLAVLSWAAFPLGLSSTKAYASTLRRICVSVHGANGEQLPNLATVTLQPVGGGSTITLGPEGTLPPVLYGGDVSEGEYILSVADIGGLWAPSCKVTIVGEQGGCIGVFMLQRSSQCLFYRVGGSLIPFQYNSSVLGVLVPGQAAAPDTAEEYAKKLAVYGLDRFLPDIHDSQSWIAAQGYIWLFSVDLPDRASVAEVAAARKAAADAIRREFQDDPRFLGLPTETIRVGAPTQLEQGYAKILDTRYVVRFKSKAGIREARKVIEAGNTNAKVLRGLSHAKDAYLIEFIDHDHPRHLRQAETWLRTGQFLYIEPDLIVELQQHACPTLPNDDVAACQEGLKRQRIPEAWCLLESELGTPQKYGYSSVCVGFIESPADPTHSDLDTARIAYCFGFDWSIPCYRTSSGGSGLELKTEFLEGGTAPLHGTWVFGVGGALTGNSQGVAGIAPTPVKVIAVPPSGVAITMYCEMVLWLAGLGVPSGSSAPLLGQPGNPPAADVISCSHGVGLMPTPAQVCDTFARVTDEGRSGKGTVLVYSAGNGNSPIENVQAFANDPHVIAVGATMVAETADGGLVEKRWVQGTYLGSNYGENLDLCAIGADVPSLDPRAGVAYTCNGSSHSRVSEQTGTSFAAPAVSAACALMLTVNSELTWCHVRDLLRKSAQRPKNASDPNLQETGSIWTNHRNRYFGSGRLDVYAAVMEALDFKPKPNEKPCTVPCNYTTMCASKDVCRQGQPG
jgi:Subtilase family